jgi:hypothetical protein
MGQVTDGGVVAGRDDQGMVHGSEEAVASRL